jgi:hypothetical protein
MVMSHRDEMTTEIKLWKIKQDDNLEIVKSSKLNLEARIETWLEKDISIISDNILIIGRQVVTSYDGVIDLLGIDSKGDLVLIELKKDKTPREITAQILDYASWVKDLSNETVSNKADDYLKQKSGLTLEEAFQKKFGIELPDVINESHSMFVAASQIDPATERIIKYLSEMYGVKINAATFQHFEDENGMELLGRAFLIQPSEVETSTGSTGKRRSNLSLDELSNIAKERGMEEFYNTLALALEKYLIKTTNRSALAFYGSIGDGKRSIFSLIPTQSSQEEGLKFQIYVSRFVNYFNTSKEILLSKLPKNKEDWKYFGGADEDYSGFVGFFQTEEEVNRFVEWLNTLKD